MTTFDLVVVLSVLVCAALVGYRLISRVPPLLHTPLMSLTNAISAVTILGALMLFANADMAASDTALAALAVALAAFNVVGGFVITNRMVRLFKKS